MEQLLSMGFSEDLASEALAATGGHSPLAAADWILTRSSSSSSVPPPPLPPSQSPSTQPCLERFFASSSAIPKTLNPSSSSAPKTPNPSTSTSSSSPSSLPLKRRHSSAAAPLSDRMRPGTLDAIVGQDHLLGPSSLLRSSLLPSLVLWGPPGSGKTTLARALAASLPGSLYTFVPLSAVSAGVRDLRDAIDGARRDRSRGRRTVLFVDEIHRFSKSQQDSFLPAIEDGSIILVGATTENPSFQLTTPLLSAAASSLSSLSSRSISRLYSAEPSRMLRKAYRSLLKLRCLSTKKPSTS
ncbi:MgsA AAA+ ATPase C terminal [Musa troglodytarum]|uniref:MgsA AAA+ ATPase C terminal n=1 Tax=Musa troglodytarum TaxID=320322 RepID=A0A9E7EBE9_9LILI|nr:MgsA AAA+ ATPase C terminal [Musa troglodytarum]